MKLLKLNFDEKFKKYLIFDEEDNERIHYIFRFENNRGISVNKDKLQYSSFNGGNPWDEELFNLWSVAEIMFFEENSNAYEILRVKDYLKDEEVINILKDRAL